MCDGIDNWHFGRSSQLPPSSSTSARSLSLSDMFNVFGGMSIVDVHVVGVSQIAVKHHRITAYEQEFSLVFF